MNGKGIIVEKNKQQNNPVKKRTILTTHKSCVFPTNFHRNSNVANNEGFPNLFT
jgi:hypothetical protein